MKVGTQPKTVTFCACVAALMAANTAQAEGETAAATPRNLKWAYAGEAFEDPANWTWAAEPAGDITTGPGEKDAVRFWGLATANAGAENTVRLAADVSVSNFNYDVQRASGKLVVDLGGKALTVLGNMNLTTDRANLNTDGITFRDGTVRVTGSAKGTANQYSQKYEDYGGFYVNLPGDSYEGLNCTLDNAVLLPLARHALPGRRRGHA